MDQAETLDRPGEVLSRYCRFAEKNHCVVAGSIKLEEAGCVYNAIAFVDADGTPCGRYYKTHLTDGEIEKGFTPGNGAVVVETQAGRLGGAICYDLNFIETAQAYASQQLDVICFPSMYHGGLMQGYWAYLCRSFFAASLPFLGGGILNPLGQPVALNDCYNAVAVADLQLDRAIIHLDFNAEKFTHLRRKYGSQITLEIPANVGSAILSAVDPAGPTAMDIVEAEQLLLLDDYFARSRSLNAQHRKIETRQESKPA